MAMAGQRELSLLITLAACLAGCQGVPAGAVREAGVGPSDGSLSTVGASLVWSRPFGEEGEVPAALITAGPERLAALTDQAIYLLTLEGRVLIRTPLPAPARGAGGASGFVWDGTGLALALRWRGDSSTQPGSYLALADETGAIAKSGLIPLGAPGVPLSSAFDGEAHVAVWAATAGAELELRESRVSRATGARSSRVLQSGLQPGLALGELLARPGELDLCSLEADGRVLLRRFRDLLGPTTVVASASEQQKEQSIGPCRIAGTQRSLLLSWKVRGETLPPPDGGAAGSVDLGLKALRFDEPVARLVWQGGAVGAGPVRLSGQTGTMRIEATLWDGGRYLVLLDAAGFRGGRLLLTILDETGELREKDLFLPIEVEPASLLPASLLAGPSDYYVLYGLRRPWDEGILYLARFSLETRGHDAQ